ncbi:cytochrome b/b6 domain-containing protein [Ramlibacter sp.]|uniref:cytochrome b/b6 domain-containing protein n=1 Tax=Ramlibacter sp. TaxID=1917967 RepID=UPI001855A6C8|nr:cytochrome b/b6 domain-containing protein [Ramlibacter sp.]MBA2673466.1 cytochrome b/b6 domain-containing protein [Ramlibacter sp.]
MANTVRVWDLPTRLFHWGLVACIIGSVTTGYIGGGWIEWHARLGYAVLALLLFRIVWGLVGGRWSRFASFVRGPGSVAAYLRGQGHPDHLVGHNPLGALSVLAMLAVLLAQVGTGLVADDEISFTGPLNRFVASAKALKATWYHKEVGQLLIIALVLLHLAAVLFYLWKKRDNLIRPMVIGDKQLDHAAPSSRDDALTRLAALVLLSVCAAAVAWLVGLGAG